MPNERPAPQVEQDQDLDNTQVVTEILESGSDEDVERLRRHAMARRGELITQDEMQRYRELARQRKRLIKESDIATKNRLATNPQANDLEYALGVYRERLEPQVSAAVFALRQKGYSSFESGFSGFEVQSIRFHTSIPELLGHVFSEKVQRAFEGTGAVPFCKANAVGFNVGAPLPDAKLKELWGVLVEDLPTLAVEQPLTTVPTAIDFRKNQDARFRTKKG